MAVLLRRVEVINLVKTTKGYSMVESHLLWCSPGCLAPECILSGIITHTIVAVSDGRPLKKLLSKPPVCYFVLGQRNFGVSEYRSIGCQEGR